MDDKMKKLVIVFAILAFVFCFSGGIWILSKTGLDHANDAVSTGIGLYFIGKAFFVGPLLMIAALKSNR